MAFQWIRRGLLAVASVSALVLAACGSGSIESQLQPPHVIVFGDGLSDLGNTGARYTVNDANVNNWAFSVAFDFASALGTSASGGSDYAVGNARITQHPDAAGNAATPTITEQITSFLSANTANNTNLYIVEGGMSDIIAETAAYKAGTETRDQYLANVGQAGRDLGAQVRRLVQAGAGHVAVLGTYDLSKTPWAVSSSQVQLLADASAKFNQELLVSIVDLGNNVLYVDTAFDVNLMVGFPGSYGLINVTGIACASVDAGPGIGIGAGEVNSKLCTTSTLAVLDANTTYDQYLWADKVYLTPAGQRQLADYVFSHIRSRW